MSKEEICGGCGKLKVPFRWWLVQLPHGVDRQKTKPYCKDCYEKKVVEDALDGGKP